MQTFCLKGARNGTPKPQKNSHGVNGKCVLFASKNRYFDIKSCPQIPSRL